MDLSNQSAIGSALLVKVAVPDEPITTFSTYWKTLTVDSIAYVGLGDLLSITNTRNNIRVTSDDLTIVISGIPASNKTFADNTLLKGSPISIYRYVFDPITGLPLNDIGVNPTGRFFGIVSNCSIEFEATGGVDRNGSITIVLQCSNTADTLDNKVAGRRTTPEDMKKYAPSDLSMDRVASLARSNFNFGAPQ